MVALVKSKKTKTRKMTREEIVAANQVVWLTEAEAAGHLKISPHTLKYWRLHQIAGKPPFYKMDDTPRATVLYKLHEINEWMSASRKEF